MSVTPCLWFNGNAEEAVDFYLSLVPDSRVVSVSHYPECVPSKAGTVLLIVFELAGRRYQALNGGTDHPFSPVAVSLSIACDTQAEIDRIWDRIVETGGRPQQCGWVTDRFGLPWQVVPGRTEEWLTGDPAAANRVMAAVMGMVKLDIPTLERAYTGEPATA